MEYCAVRGIFNQRLGAHNQQFNIHQDESHRFTIAALHEIYVGSDRGGTGPAYQLLRLRVERLVPYVLQNLEGFENPRAKDIKDALEVSFKRVNDEVYAKARELEFKCHEVYLETKLNSTVVLVHGGFVYVAGVTHAHVILARDSKPCELIPDGHRACRETAMLTEKFSDGGNEPTLFHFRQERVEATDEYLVLASAGLLDYVRDRRFLLPILQSRIDVEGLNEACKSMVGPFEDDNKILIVITLQPHAHEPKGSDKHLQYEDAMKKGLLDTGWYAEDYYTGNIEDSYREDPLRFLLPYVNGKKQHPVPLTTCEYFALRIIPAPCSEDKLKIESSIR